MDKLFHLIHFLNPIISTYQVLPCLSTKALLSLSYARERSGERDPSGYWLLPVGRYSLMHMHAEMDPSIPSSIIVIKKNINIKVTSSFNLKSPWTEHCAIYSHHLVTSNRTTTLPYHTTPPHSFTNSTIHKCYIEKLYRKTKKKPLIRIFKILI